MNSEEIHKTNQELRRLAAEMKSELEAIEREMAETLDVPQQL